MCNRHHILIGLLLVVQIACNPPGNSGSDNGETSLPSTSSETLSVDGKQLDEIKLPLALPGTANQEGPVVARVAGVPIHESALSRRFEAVPEFARHRYEGKEGREQLVRGLVEEHLVLRAAVDDGLHRDPEVVGKLSSYITRLLAQTYYQRRTEELAGISPKDIQTFMEEHPAEVAQKQREIEEQHGQSHVMTGALAHTRSGVSDKLQTWLERRILVPDEMVREYYDSNRHEFKIVASVRARHIQFGSQERAAEIRDRLALARQNGNLEETFDSLAREHSKDRATGARGGNLGVIPKTGTIPFLGNEPAIHEELFSTGDGELTPVLQSRRGFHIFWVVEHLGEGTMPYNEVEDRIRDQLYFQRIEKVEEQVFEELKEQYPVEVLDDVTG